MRICLMIEGQEDVSWSDWVALARACEAHDFDALFRSDHYLSVMGQTARGSLDAWATITALAALTEDLRLGTLVSPVTFRHPSALAKAVVSADHISGGRIEVGLGAGWMEAEHRTYGFPFPPLGVRMAMLEEQLEIVTAHFNGGPATIRGEHYSVEDLDAHPRPVQPGGPPILMGGAAKPRSVALAARFADEYNTVFATLEECRERRAAVAEACERAGRHPIVFSLMTGFVIGADEAEVADRRRRLAEWRGNDEIPESWVTGTPEQAAEQLRALEAVGVERIMLQHLLHTDIDAVELIGRELIPIAG
jgi:F420-dependent oxidoreductase-like protein